jgi:hypothetical protein
MPGVASAAVAFTNTSHITVAHSHVESGSDYRDNILKHGDIGVGVASDGLDAISNAGAASLTLTFGSRVTLGSMPIYNGYRNRDDGTCTLKDGAGTVLGAWTVSTSGGGTNEGVDSFWLAFTAPVSTNELEFSTTSTDALNTNSHREIQVFGTAMPCHAPSHRSCRWWPRPSPTLSLCRCLWQLEVHKSLSALVLSLGGEM